MFKELFVKYKPLILVLIVVLGSFFAYLNIYSHEFLWDDEFLIQNNIFIRSWENLPKIFTTCSGAGAGRLDNFYRPMQTLFYTLIYSFFKLNPFGYLFLNVLLHLSNAILIFLLLKKISKNDYLAALVSFFWVIHPVHTEAITYMSGTADPLSVFFALISFLLYFLFKKNKNWIILSFSILTFILALLSKETMIIFPGLIILYELLFSDKQQKILNCRFVIPFLIISMVYFILRLTVLNFINTLNIYEDSNVYTDHLSIRIITFLSSLIMYYSFIFWPVNLHMERDFPIFTNPLSWQPLVSIIIILIFIIVIIRELKQKATPLLSFGLGWFFIGFVPMSGLIPVNSFLLEHWLYFTSIGLFLCLAVGLRYLWKRISKIKPIIISILIIMAAILISLNLFRNRDWRNPIIFYNNILKYASGTARVHNNLAMAYVDENDLIKAEKHYLKAIEISDIYAQTHYNLAMLYLKTNREKKAVEQLLKSIEINKNFFFSYQALGAIYKQNNEIEKAQEYYQQAEQIKYY